MFSIKYVGSKSRIAKYIVPIIQDYIDSNAIKDYYEPFVGGANIIDKIRCENRYASDINPYLISLMQNLDKIYSLPDMISKDEYAKVRNAYRNHTKEYPLWYIGAIGFLASYNAKFFGGYAGKVHCKTGNIRNYYDEVRRNIILQIPNLMGIQWSVRDYSTYTNIKNSLIYCDIPYQNKTGYGTNFDYEEFWKWAEKLSVDNIVLVSEESAPDNWKSIWEQDVKRTLDNSTRKNAKEKLFMIVKN